VTLRGKISQFYKVSYTCDLKAAQFSEFYMRYKMEEVREVDQNKNENDSFWFYKN